MLFKWLPLPLDLWVPKDFKDFETGWFVKLLIASLEAETPGYLPVTRELWSLAGSHDGRFFQREGTRVLARFEAQQFGRHRCLFFPPLVAVIEEQMRKIRGKRPREGGSFPQTEESYSHFHRLPQVCGSPSLSTDLGFAFEVGSKEKRSLRKSKSGFTEADFVDRDLRKMREARDQLDKSFAARIGSNDSMTERQAFEWVCSHAGITVRRGLAIEKIAREWPEDKADAAAS